MLGTRTAGATLLLAALAVVPAAALLWPHLPPLFEDEILPLVPLVPLLKEPGAYGDAFLANRHVDVFGYPIALVSYVIEGPLKALCYAAVLPLTRAAYRPEHIIAAYRASNLVWTWALFGLILAACRALAGWRAALLCLALLVPDHSLVYLSLTDLGRPFQLLFGLLLLLVLCRHVDEPRWRTVLPVAVVTFLGEWNRADFLWFMAAGLGGCVVVDLLLRRLATPAVLAGYLVGLGLTYAVVPQYLEVVTMGAGHHIPLTDLPRAWAHLRALTVMMDPWGAYHRHLDVGAQLFDGPYVAYRWAYLGLCAVVPVALGVSGLRARRAAYLVLAVFPPLLLAAIAGTAETYEVHHVTIVKPVLYVAASVLAAHLAGPRRAPVLIAWAGLGVAALWVHARAFADVTAAAPTRGIYGVTWNMSEAWQAATRSDAKVIIGVDFGVWVPGVLSSPRDQRWESSGIPDEATLEQVMAREPLVGFVVRADGPNAWLLGSERYPVVERQRFDAHPGDPWAFVALRRAP